MSLRAFVRILVFGVAALLTLWIFASGGPVGEMDPRPSPDGADEPPPAIPVPAADVDDPAAGAAPETPGVPGRPWEPAALEWGWLDDEGLPETEGMLSVSGRMTDERGEPVPAGLIRGAFVRCRGGFGVYSGRGRIVDGEYGFVMRQFHGRGHCLFEIRAPGHVPHRVKGDEVTWAELAEERSVEGVDLVLRRAATVHGTVTNADGTPKRGACIALLADPSEAEGDGAYFFLTGDDGRYRLDEIDPSTTAWLTASLGLRAYGGRADPVPLEGRLRPGEEVRIDLRLPACTWFELELEFASWRKGLRIRDSGGFSHDIERTWTTNLKTGYHRFTIVDPEDEEWRHEVEMTVPHGETTWRIVVDLPPPREK